MESGTLTVESGNRNFHNSHFADLTTQTGCIFINPNSEETLNCLRSLSLESLLDAEIAVNAADSLVNSDLETFIPVVDGDFLPDVPSKLFRQGRYAKVSMIAGWTQDDGTLFTPQNVTTEEDGISFFENGLFIREIDTKALFSLYHPLDFQPPGSVNVSPYFYQSARILRDIFFCCNAIFMGSEVVSQSHYNSKARQSTGLQRIFDTFMGSSPGQNGMHAPEVFLYELNQTALTPRFAAFGIPDLGVTHVADIPYVFNEVSNPSLGLNNTESNRLLATQMSKSWASFATSGKPSFRGKGTLQGWTPAFTDVTRESEARVFVIGGPNEGMTPIEGKSANDAVKSQKLAARCGFITSARLQAELFD
jgi:carboxylesterase type B